MKTTTTRTTLDHYRRLLFVGQEIRIDVVNQGLAWTARASGLGQAWTRGHAFPRSAALTVALKILLPRAQRLDPTWITVVNENLRWSTCEAFILTVPKAWKGNV